MSETIELCLYITLRRMSYFWKRGQSLKRLRTGGPDQNIQRLNLSQVETERLSFNPKTEKFQVHGAPSVKSRWHYWSRMMAFHFSKYVLSIKTRHVIIVICATIYHLIEPNMSGNFYRFSSSTDL